MSGVRALLAVVLVAATAVAVPAAPGAGAATAVDPTTVNLLSNGSFETGGAVLSPWIFRHDVAASLSVGTGDAVDGSQVASVHIAATSPSTWLVQLRQENVHLHGAVTYRLSFFAKASTGRVMNARLQSPISPNPTFIDKDFTLTTGWQQFSLTYTATVDVANAFVGFDLAQATGDVEIDQVALTGDNLLPNAGFETGGATLAPWTFRNDIDATVTRDTTVHVEGAASAKITVATIGTTSWQAQLRGRVPPVVAGERYQLTFQVRASRSRTGQVRLQGANAPYPTAAVNNFTATTAWTRISFEWTPTITVTDTFLGFNLAQDTGTIWLDDITLTHPTGIVVGWGHNSSGEATPPPGLRNVTAISAGIYHSLALRSDGTVVGWGYNGDGQTTPPGGLRGATAISAGGFHSLALKRNGTVVGWGFTLVGAATPPAGLSDVIAISAGSNHSLALKGDGTVVGWGYNGSGEATSPAGLTDVIAIDAGDQFDLALKRDGTVVGWGNNSGGAATPPAGLTDVIAIAAGFLHGLALKHDGTVVGWGDNSSGEATPPAGLTDVIAIAAGDGKSVALKRDGTVIAWGRSVYPGVTTPEPAVLNGVTAISTGRQILALKA